MTSYPNALRAVERLTALGWSRVQACAIVGGLQQESYADLRPTVVGDKMLPGGAHGFAQWRQSRFEALQAFAAATGRQWQDIEAQIEFVDRELRTTEKAAGKRLQKATTIEDATAAAVGYERPRGWTVEHPERGDGWAYRLRNARELMGQTEPKVAGQSPPRSVGAAAAPAVPAAKPKEKAAVGQIASLVGKGIVKLGDQGETVRQIQLSLARFGYKLTGTGYFGGATDTAVSNFQKLAGLDIDGDVGADTAAMLDRLIAELDKGKAPAVVSVPDVGDPLWVTEAFKWTSEKETPGAADNPDLVDLAERAGFKNFHDSTPWCAMFVNAMLAMVGLKGTGTLWALDFRDKPWGVTLAGPARGAIMPMTRTGGGHVAICLGKDSKGQAVGISGNKGDRVSIDPYTKDRTQWWRWPKNTPLPAHVGWATLPLVKTDGHVVTSET